MGRIRGKVEESCFFFFKGKKVQFSRNVKEKTMVVDHILQECLQRFRKTFQNTFFFIPNLNIYIYIYNSILTILFSTIYRLRWFFITKINQKESIATLNSVLIDRERERVQLLFISYYRAKREIERSISRLTKSRVLACREILESVHGSLCHGEYVHTRDVYIGPGVLYFNWTLPPRSI